MSIVIHALAFIGLFIIVNIGYFTLVDPIVDNYKILKRKKTLEFWKEEITDKQYSWKGDVNYDEHVSFTLDFLRNYDKNLREGE